MPAVAAALAWVTRLLWFAPRDMANIATQHMEAINRTLASLRRRGQLQPSHASFTTAAFIVRALLDELLPRLGMNITVISEQPGREMVGKASGQRQSPSVISIISSEPKWTGVNEDDSSLPRLGRPGPEQNDLSNGETFSQVHESSATAVAVDRALLPREGREDGDHPGSWLLDQRVLQLCCPQLDAARQALQVTFPPYALCSTQILCLNGCVTLQASCLHKYTVRCTMGQEIHVLVD